MSTDKKERMEIVCPDDVIDGKDITKDKRKELFGNVAGGKGSMKPENFQRDKIIQGTGRPCHKTHFRINMRTNEMVSISHPMNRDDGFGYTENFDGKQIFNNNIVWINLKSVVGKGGAQTRTLRDQCYPFVEHQLKYLIKTNRTDCFFANIFDGDHAAEKKKHFNYLLSLPEYSEVKKYLYVGDLKGYFAWVNENAN